MPFFNRNWAGACEGRWAGPGLVAGWSAGSWIVGVEVGLLQCWSASSRIVGGEVGLLQPWSAGSGHGSPLQKQEERRVGEGFARGRSDA